MMISHWNDFRYFLSTSHPDALNQLSSQLAFWFRKMPKTDFQYGCHGGHLGFLVRMMLAIFDQLALWFRRMAFWFRRKSLKLIFKMAAVAAILDC